MSNRQDPAFYAKAINSRNKALEKAINDFSGVNFLATIDGDQKTRDVAKRFTVKEIASLQKAEPYHWEYNALMLATEGGKGIPKDIPFHQSWLFGDVGWWWFGDNSPIKTKCSVEKVDEIVPINALLYFWNEIEGNSIYGDRAGANFTRGGPCVTLVPFTLTHTEPHAGPVPLAIADWFQDETIGERLQVVERMPVDSRFDHNYKDTLEKTIQIFAAGSLWLQQKITSITETNLPAAVKRKLKKLDIAQSSYVVTLRRKEYLPHEDTQHRDWNVRWIVRGHWRLQPTKDGIKPIFIHPFIKGPEGKPLKPPSERIFHAAR